MIWKKAVRLACGWYFWIWEGS